MLKGAADILAKGRPTVKLINPQGPGRARPSIAWVMIHWLRRTLHRDFGTFFETHGRGCLQV
ncbi:MAG: hypothetical protein AMJ81_07970 [Phycisphaerae bacterium SM23_33]|nr:MAG: hypothetical protein AMJ81_07970 [Phycisphaerae bacterium SM23_33]